MVRVELLLVRGSVALAVRIRKWFKLDPVKRGPNQRKAGKCYAKFRKPFISLSFLFFCITLFAFFLIDQPPLLLP